jgi:hypothetical protein
MPLSGFFNFAYCLVCGNRGFPREQKIPKREVMSEHLQPTHTHFYDLEQGSGDRKLGNGEIVELQIGGVERGFPPQTDEENEGNAYAL